MRRCSWPLVVISKFLQSTVASIFHDWLNEVSGNPTNPAYIPSIYSTNSQHMNFKRRLINFLLTHYYLSWQMHYFTNSQLKFVKMHFSMDLPYIKDLQRYIFLCCQFSSLVKRNQTDDS